MRNVTKEIFLKAVLCPTLGWLLRSGRLADESAGTERTLGEKFRIEQGNEVHKRGKELYPDGLLIESEDFSDALKKAKHAMDASGSRTVLDGAFSTKGFAARADILKREKNGWHLIEVKSSINDKEEFIDDMGYTGMVLHDCDIKLTKLSLLLISKDFRLGMPISSLFIEIDHTSDVLDRVKEFNSIKTEIDRRTSAPLKPKSEFLYACRDCDMFKTCVGEKINHPIFEIPRLGEPKFNELKSKGIFRIEDIPKGFPLTENQAIVKDSVQKKAPFVADTLKSDLDKVVWPAYYLDFETVMTAIPLYPDIAPFTQIPSQFSIHKCSNPGCVIDHKQYLADPKKDCRKELTERLISHLGQKGSIIIYSNFEKTVIGSLSKLYPSLSKELNVLIDRMVNLEAIIRKNYYHPEFHGSISIKNTLPVLVPGMSYANLQIQSGDSAMAAFAYLALGKYKDEKEVESVRAALLDYCKQDTLAMVNLHQELCRI